jgi:hypothetical protein
MHLAIEVTCTAGGDIDTANPIRIGAYRLFDLLQHKWQQLQSTVR